MKKHKDSITRLTEGKTTRTAILLVIVAAVTLEATSVIQGVFARQKLQEEMSMQAENHLSLIKSEIMNIINQAEAAVRNKVWIAQWSLDHPDSLGSVGRLLVRDNPVIVGSTVALVPGYDPDRPLHSPYTFRSGDSLVTRSLATEAYDYPSMEWFTKPLELHEGYWSEPYVDEGGGDMLMTTYSVPISDETGRDAAVLTGDISLDWLTELVNSLKVYPHSRSILLSRTGLFMVSPQEEMVMVKTVDEVVHQLRDSLSFKALNRDMLEGRSGKTVVRIDERKHHVYYAPVERTGWSMCIIIPDDDIFHDLRKNDILTRILELLGLVMLIILIRSSVRSQMKNYDLIQRKERMEGELQVASKIQRALVPDPLRSFTERKDLDMAATIIPAKEVGGDLYDFFILNGKLFFCIGDVSGKGVPASLVMAVTLTAFRAVSAQEDSPSKIVSSMNDGMVEMNEDNLFVTFFCGVLDLDTGHLRYCNAGHNPPMALTDRITNLPVLPNLPLGVMRGFPFVEQEMDLHYDDALFLYTDGVTEAQNDRQELFGEVRLEQALHGKKSATDHIGNIRQRVADFVGDAPQSDDLTMLFLHYLGQKKEYHLTLVNDLRQLSLLTGFVDRIREENDLAPGLDTRINLALEEAACNVIMYAYPEGTAGTLNLDAVREGNRLRFTLSDQGKAFDPTAAREADLTASVEDRPIGGLGIHLVRTIMDSIHYERVDGKNVLTMIINL
jgi:Serine phosphatase RsbU, regulator of sigma subunit